MSRSPCLRLRRLPSRCDEPRDKPAQGSASELKARGGQIPTGRWWCPAVAVARSVTASARLPPATSPSHCSLGRASDVRAGGSRPLVRAGIPGDRRSLVQAHLEGTACRAVDAARQAGPCPSHFARAHVTVSRGFVSKPKSIRSARFGRRIRPFPCCAGQLGAAAPRSALRGSQQRTGTARMSSRQIRKQ